MKVSIDIPAETLETLMRFSGTKSAQEAILAAVNEFLRRREIDAVVATFGTWDIDTNEQIESADLSEWK